MHLMPCLELRRFSLDNRCYHPNFLPQELLGPIRTKARKSTGATEQSKVSQARLFQKAPEFGDLTRVP